MTHPSDYDYQNESVRTSRLCPSHCNAAAELRRTLIRSVATTMLEVEVEWVQAMLGRVEGGGGDGGGDCKGGGCGREESTSEGGRETGTLMVEWRCSRMLQEALEVGYDAFGMPATQMMQWFRV